MTDLSDLAHDDDTGSIGEAARRKVQNARAEVKAVGVEVVALRASTGTRFAIVFVLLAAGVLVAGGVAAQQAASATEDATTRTRLDAMQRQLDRMEQQIDRIAERSDNR